MNFECFWPDGVNVKHAMDRKFSALQFWIDGKFLYLPPFSVQSHFYVNSGNFEDFGEF